MTEETSGAPSAPDEGLWIALLAILHALERRFPGIVTEVHDEAVAEVSLAEVVRLRGKRTERALIAAYGEAARRLGEIAVIAPRVAEKPKSKSWWRR